MSRLEVQAAGGRIQTQMKQADWCSLIIYCTYIHTFFFRVGRQASTGTGGQADGQAG